MGEIIHQRFFEPVYSSIENNEPYIIKGISPNGEQLFILKGDPPATAPLFHIDESENWVYELVLDSPIYSFYKRRKLE